MATSVLLTSDTLLSVVSASIPGPLFTIKLPTQGSIICGHEFDGSRCNYFFVLGGLQELFIMIDNGATSLHDIIETEFTQIDFFFLINNFLNMCEYLFTL